MSEMVFNPTSETEIGIIERHHVDSIMSATDMGVEAPDEEDRTLRIVDSYASNASNDIGQLDKAYGFKVVSQVAKSLPFEKSLLSKLLFENDNDDLKQKMIDNDQDSMNSNCFWSQEIEILIINRDENK